ncbi:fasciclin domain-containing protein [Qipengyuania marisflavi]|uniref:Fasciclin domain-containing protein n=1 Tax=Qipengyuania marisflavi TaxID=2486356 RepID=A0A5S3P6N8_9SPHN|nr:fasciclin domain-containing protein [Qipengyuania marisflavi]TMM48891.1 fasciclin domain-containing protein [Qipengyuania marisflavi]
MIKRIYASMLPLAGALALGGCMMSGDMAMDDMNMDDVAYVDGAAMYSNKTIVANAVNSPIHTTLVKAVTAAGLVDTLNSAGPFTVFAPTDEAFSRVPSATLNSLMMPSMKSDLAKVLTYHVVPGRITAADIMAKIKAGGGTAMYKTVAGENLTFHMQGGSVMIMGMNNSSAYVTQADVMQSNGVIHVVNGVLLPSM